MRVLPAQPARFVGELERARDGLRVRPAGSRGAPELRVRPADSLGAEPGELVVVERAGGPAARPRLTAGSPSGWARRAIRAPSRCSPRTATICPWRSRRPPSARPRPPARSRRASGRHDLRDLPLVTIDGAGRARLRRCGLCERDGCGLARWWSRSPTSRTMCGRAMRSISRRAQRGNSVYFPDRVLPMLPEALSSGLCSLRPDEDRACLAAHLWLDASGRVRRHRFERALMRSRARLTYEQVQAAADGAADDVTAPLIGFGDRAAVRRVRRPARGAREARHARSRGAGGADPARRERPADRCARPRPAGFAPSDRGDDDRRQRRRGGDPGAGFGALHVPGPRPARSGQDRGPGPAAGKPGPRQRAQRARQAQGPDPADPPARDPGADPAGQHAWCCGRRARPPTARTISAISGSISAAMRISPRRSGAMPTSWCIAP